MAKLIILLILIIIGQFIFILIKHSQFKHLKVKSLNKNNRLINLETEKARNIVLNSLETAFSTIDSHPTSNIVKVKDVDIRSAIIGKNGRNLKLLEKLTGTDIVFDNTDPIVIVSCFNPIKREIATNLIKELIKSKKINSIVIEEKYDLNVVEIDKALFQKGNAAFQELNLVEKNQDIIYNIGKLYFRYSYGQNVLTHSIETAKIMGQIARELNCDVDLAKRAGLFHDVGKAFDISQEGSHVSLGVEYAKKVKESNEVIDAIASHHGDQDSTTFIGALVQFADKLSASRPGARKKTTEKLVSRVKQMESVAKMHNDVKDAYVIKGGKEIRVIIKPKSGVAIVDIAKNIKDQFETQLKFPGIISIVVIKENKFKTEAIQNKSK